MGIEPLHVPWYVVAWRLIWYVPAHLARILLCLILFCGWGWRSARDTWETTR